MRGSHRDDARWVPHSANGVLRGGDVALHFGFVSMLGRLSVITSFPPA
jgi:hypothetical protein